MARSKNRTSEIHFYEWYISRWQTSEAHDELDATGRGIYREMLDICYAQGSVSSDLEVLSRRCACTVAEIESRWTFLRKHFRQDRTNKSRLVNDLASLFRRNHFEYVSRQQQNGSKGGSRKSNGDKGLRSGGLPIATPPLNPSEKPDCSQERRKEKEERRKENKVAVASPPLADRFHEWIEEYPNPTKIETAARAWINLIDRGEIHEGNIEEVFEGLRRYKQSAAWAKENGKWICEPTTFLIGNEKHGGRMWMDRPAPAKAQVFDMPDTDVYDKGWREERGL